MLWTCFKCELLNQILNLLIKALQEDNLSLTSLFEELFAVFSWEGDCSGDVANQLDDVRKVVLVPRVLLTRVRLEQVVPWR